MGKQTPDTTTADLAVACKLMALALCRQPEQAAPAARRPRPKGRKGVAPRGTPNTTGGVITGMHPNEVTGNGHIPKSSSNYGLRGLR